MVKMSVHEQSKRTRAERAMRLYNERGSEIRKAGPQTYLVPRPTSSPDLEEAAPRATP